MKLEVDTSVSNQIHLLNADKYSHGISTTTARQYTESRELTLQTVERISFAKLLLP